MQAGKEVQNLGLEAVTPRRTRLLRAQNLQSFQTAIVDAITGPSQAEPESGAVIVPSRSAATQLRYTIEALTNSSEQIPALLTRSEWYARLHQRLPGSPPALSDCEREFLLSEAARDTTAAGISPPFIIRPGLVGKMLAFYDALRRQRRTLDDFARLTVGELELSAPIDRGAARMLDQTNFLVNTFMEFEALVTATARLDEHQLRARLLTDVCQPPFRHVVITVGEQPVSTDGLWLADFDLLTRMPHLEQIDVVMTEGFLSCGFLERIHELLPGIKDERVEASQSRQPSLEIPIEAEKTYFIHRDREEELWAIARRLKSNRLTETDQETAADGAVGVVFQRPLPYLYLAEQIFGGSKISFETVHGFPLAAEPYAAFVDLVLDVAISKFAREDLTALLRSPHLHSTGCNDDGKASALSAESISALSRNLEQAGYVGGRDDLKQLADSWHQRSDAEEIRHPLNTSLAIADALAPLETVSSASEAWHILLTFLKQGDPVNVGSEADRERQRNVREAICSVIGQLEKAAKVSVSPRVTPSELKASLRRRIEAEVFTPHYDRGGVRLVDAAAAKYGRFRALFVVGLVHGEWATLPPRNVFYPTTLLQQLGWPSEAQATQIGRAEFTDLLFLPTRHVRLSTFQLEHDALATPATLLEDVPEVDLSLSPEPRFQIKRASTAEMFSGGPIVPSVVTGEVMQWLAARRSICTGREAKPGIIGALEPRTYTVSRVERYLNCPFKYFCASVLQVDEEPDIALTLTRRAQGELLHEVLRKFVETWQALGHFGFAVEDIDAALTLARRIVDQEVTVLSPVDRQLARSRLLGSAAGTGLVERFIRIETARPGEVIESHVERPFSGEFEFLNRAGAKRRVRIRGVTDRVDLLADGSLRIIDYKLGRPARSGRAVQLPVYMTCVSQDLARSQNQSCRPGEAAYVAFGASEPRVPIFTPGEGAESVLNEGQARFLEAVDGIESGEFPPRPAEDRLCSSCGFAAVCRKGKRV